MASFNMFGSGRAASVKKAMVKKALRDMPDPEGPSLTMKFAGVSLAAGSLLFAGNMIAGRSDKNDLASPSTGINLAWHQGTGVLGPFDYMPTGTTAGNGNPPANAKAGSGSSGVVDGVPYVLRAAGPKSALVEGPPGRVTEVSPGVNLPTAGRVISIEKRPTGWVVVTTLRTIQ